MEEFAGKGNSGWKKAGGGVDLNSKGEKGGIPAQEVEEPRGD